MISWEEMPQHMLVAKLRAHRQTLALISSLADIEDIKKEAEGVENLENLLLYRLGVIYSAARDAIKW